MHNAAATVEGAYWVFNKAMNNYTTEHFYNKYGKFALFIGYFIPGVRHLTAIFAGAYLMPYRTFALFSYTGGFLWTITLVSLGYFLGEKWRRVYMYSHRFIIPLVLLSIVVLLIGTYWKTVNAKSKKGIKELQ